MAPQATPAARGWRLRAALVTATVVVGGLVPMTWPDGRDDFPLSPYPMFSGRMADATVDLVVAWGDGPDGPEPLPTVATGHRQLTQAARALADAVAAGGDRPARLCDEIAAWTASERPDLGRVRIATVRYDALRFFGEDLRLPVVIAVHAACDAGTGR